MKEKLFHTLSYLVLVSVIFTACQASPAATATPIPTAIPNTPTAEPTPMPEDPQITLYYDGNSQYEIISPQGVRVLVDACWPTFLSSPATDQDILLTTHNHADHYTASFAQSFPGQQLSIETGEIKVKDVAIRGIMAGHGLTNFAAAGSPNVIFIIDVAGIRIVDFGDFGQESLTPELASVLGEVDIAISILGNTAFFQKITDEKTIFTFMGQLKPKLIIPTAHADTATVGYATEQWQGFYSDAKSVTIRLSDLSGNTKFLMLGTLATSYHNLYGLPSWATSTASR